MFKLRDCSRFLFSLVIVGGGLFTYILKQNQITLLQMRIPCVAQETRALQEENLRLRYQICQFRSPDHLLELARSAEYSHLHYPSSQQIVVLQGETPLLEPTTSVQMPESILSSAIVGAKH